MENLNPKGLKAEAVRRLGCASFNPKHLILINTGAVVVLGLLVNALNFLLSHQIGSTGGLGGLGMRSMLQTVQTLVSYVSSLITPFWAAGLLFCFIGIVRGEQVGPGSMLQGFRRFPKLLSFSLFQALALIAVLFPVTYLASIVYMLSPMSSSFAEALTPMIESGALLTAGGTINLDAIPYDVLMRGTVPVIVLFLALFIPVTLFLSYTFHMGPYLIMTDSVRGGFHAMSASMRMMRGHRRDLFKLDLSYWWFYALEVLAMLILYADMILEMFHVALPFSPTVTFFVTLVLYGALELGLHYWKKAERDTAFVVAYERIAPPADEPGEIRV